jgi:uncharacterized membrane protein
MLPLMVLVGSIAAFWVIGQAGAVVFQDQGFVLRAALALMFLLTASAHWRKRRPHLIRMVPPLFPSPDLLVSITGVLEILDAIGLLLPVTARLACVCLILLLVALFPGNVYAARHNVTIAGERVPGVPMRALIQLIFIATLAVSARIR